MERDGALVVPRVVEGASGELAVLVYLPANPCAKCKSAMVHADYLGPYNTNHKIPNGFTQRLAKIGVVVESGEMWESGLCRQCATEGAATFICALCEEERTSDLVQETYGDPPSRLCKVCYETATARTWDEARSRLYKVHRYDFV